MRELPELHGNKPEPHRAELARKQMLPRDLPGTAGALNAERSHITIFDNFMVCHLISNSGIDDISNLRDFTECYPYVVKFVNYL
jgi:hypothetical protein